MDPRWTARTLDGVSIAFRSGGCETHDFNGMFDKSVKSPLLPLLLASYSKVRNPVYKQKSAEIQNFPFSVKVFQNAFHSNPRGAAMRQAELEWAGTGRYRPVPSGTNGS